MEQVGQPDRAAAGVQPAVQLGDAVRLYRIGVLSRIRLPAAIRRRRDTTCRLSGAAFQEPVERILNCWARRSTAS